MLNPEQESDQTESEPEDHEDLDAGHDDEEEDDYGEEDEDYGDEEEPQPQEGRKKKKKSTSRKLWKQAVSKNAAHDLFRKTTPLCGSCRTTARSAGLLSRRNLKSNLRLVAGQASSVVKGRYPTAVCSANH